MSKRDHHGENTPVSLAHAESSVPGTSPSVSNTTAPIRLSRSGRAGLLWREWTTSR